MVILILVMFSFYAIMFNVSDKIIEESCYDRDKV